MRRTLAAVAIAAAAFTPTVTANAAPDCDIAQNCPCLLITAVLEKVTGDPTLTCV